MQFSAVLNIFIVKTYLNSIVTNDLKRKEFFSKNVQSFRLSLFKKQTWHPRCMNETSMNTGNDKVLLNYKLNRF